MRDTKLNQFYDWILGKGEWPFGKNFQEVPLPRITVLSGADVAKIQAKKCDWCSEPAETDEFCEKHYSFYEKHQYDG